MKKREHYLLMRNEKNWIKKRNKHTYMLYEKKDRKKRNLYIVIKKKYIYCYIRYIQKNKNT